MAVPLDLFRYSDEAIAHGKGDGQDWTIGAVDPFFSIDGGATRLVDFASGASVDYAYNGAGVDVVGDGFQGSHWAHDLNDPAGIFDAAIGSGMRRNLSSLDVQALDVMGWDRITPPSGQTYSSQFSIQSNDVASGGYLLEPCRWHSI